MTKSVGLIFPHQLFERNPLLALTNEFYIIEESLFFRQFNFHKQKIAFHRASMKSYADLLKGFGATTHYIDADHELADIRNFKKEIKNKGVDHIHVMDPTDDWLLQRLKNTCRGISLSVHDSPLFLNSKDGLTSFFRADKKFFFQTTFYKQQRQKRNILIDPNGLPTGGHWTYDTENRKKYPKGKTAPPIQFPETNNYWIEAVNYTRENFPENLGAITEQPIYPIDHVTSQSWLDQFFNFRFHEFGPYEDAIVKEELILNHSVISPLLNAGLLTPHQVIDQCLNYAKEHYVPINSLEGFIRQIIGWREFIRGMYEVKGGFARTKNYWNFSRPIPSSFYTGETGIPPIDETIKKVLKTGYCHHIERLMVLGNFMLLCEFDPDEVYQWFMELFIDAYDWVMVPNVYGMVLFADGGTFATKPYIGGANYIKKMSNYQSGEWEQVWNGLFWRFVNNQQQFFKSNPRTSMLAHTWNKMNSEKKAEHLQQAETFLSALDK
jgi:deoxyribodipyrimidine photolyase-related protein